MPSSLFVWRWWWESAGQDNMRWTSSDSTLQLPLPCVLYMTGETEVVEILQRRVGSGTVVRPSCCNSTHPQNILVPLIRMVVDWNGKGWCHNTGSRYFSAAPSIDAWCDLSWTLFFLKRRHVPQQSLLETCNVSKGRASMSWFVLQGIRWKLVSGMSKGAWLWVRATVKALPSSRCVVHLFFRSLSTEKATSNEERHNDAWFKTAKDQKAWKKMESKFATMTAAAPNTWRQSRRTGGHVW